MKVGTGTILSVVYSRRTSVVAMLAIHRNQREHRWVVETKNFAGAGRSLWQASRHCLEIWHTDHRRVYALQRGRAHA